jgi:hypothetical protein
VVGQSAVLSAPAAALVNGTAAHALVKVRVLIVLKVLMVPGANGGRTSPHRWRQHPEPC